MSEGLRVRLPSRYECDLVYIQDDRAGIPRLKRPAPFGLGEPKASADPFHSSVFLGWDASLGARCYRLIVSENAGLSAPIVSSAVVLPRTGLRLEPERDYYWSVSAHGWGGETAASGGTGHFRTPPRAPMPGIAFLSDLQWESATAGADNPVRRDVNYYGRPLSVGGRDMPKGLWTHAFNDATPADIVFDLAGHADAEFKATVGLDGQAGGGSVRFTVLLDGSMVAESPVLRQGQCHEIRVRVGRASKLVLRVENGGDGYQCDHSVWGLARLVEPGAQDPLL
jgi:hypothetical protein